MIELKEHNKAPYERLCRMLETEQKAAYVSATGTGKSYVVAKYIEEHGFVESALILVPSSIIRRGWEKLLPGVEVKTYQGLSVGLPPAKAHYDVIVCDEMHHLGADSWGGVYRELIEGFTGKLIGLTATPIRFLDAQRNMAEEFFEGNLVVGYELPEAVSEGILPTFHYITALYNIPVKEKKDANEYTRSLFRQLDVLKSKYSFQRIISENLKQSQKVSVFVNEIGAIDEILEICRQCYPDANHYVAHSKMPKPEVERVFEAFETAKGLSFIYTVDLLNEGYHLKGVDTVIMFRKTKSPTVYLQQLGRGLSSDMAGKKVLVLDFVANHANLKSYMGIKSSTIQWIADSIENPERQIVVSDYALEELELLDKINSVMLNFWQPHEDELLREHYDKGRGLDKLTELLPERSRASIVARARMLGLSKKKKLYGEELAEDIRRFYLEEGGLELLKERYPDVSATTIVSMANKMGIKRRERGKAWSEEEDAYLLEHKDDTVAEVAAALGRSKASVVGRRFNQNIISRPRKKWTEAEDEILRQHPDMTNAELANRFFPEWTTTVVAARRKKLRLSRDNRWSKERIDLFCELYEKGGPSAVMEHPDFAGMTKNAVGGAATRYGCKAPERGNTVWTAEEEAIILDYIRQPVEERVSMREFAEQFPMHSFHSVKGKYAHLREKEAANA